MFFKRYFYVTLVCILVVLMIIVGTIVVVDPYQQYRKSDIFIHNQRLENPGVAKHHDYDAVIVGSSMAMNHYPSQVDSLFGWNTINLTTMGGLDSDYILLLPHIARQEKIKNMIWCLDYFSFSLPITFLSEPYLYDNNLWNDCSYWFNYSSLKNVVVKLKKDVITHRDSLYHFSSPSGRERLLKCYDCEGHEKYFEKYDFTRMTERFDAMVSVVMPALKNVEVFIYFSPYSILEFNMFEKYGHWEQVLDIKQYMIEKLLNYTNVKLYDFQKEEFICNLDEYMDLRHHSHAYNKRIVECMHKDSCRVSEDNYKKDLAVLDSLVRHYRLND